MPPTEPALNLRLFGPLDLQLHGQALPRKTPQATLNLLALLALRHDRDTERAWLAGLFWPDAPEANALFYLRRSLTQLRQALGPEAHRLLSPTPRTLRLDLAAARCDMIDFDRCIAVGDRQALETAVTLYDGPLLEGHDDEWILPERHKRAEQVCNSLETLAEQALRNAEYDRAVSWLRRLLAADPLRERAVRTLMQALARQGDQVALIQLYRDFRLLLHQEMHSQPEAQTSALYRHLRAEFREKAQAPLPALAPAAASPPLLRHLPAPLSTFIGRQTETQTLLSLLETTRLLTLTGAGGGGKTRLAIAVAVEVAEEYPDGVCFVDLSAHRDPARVVQAVAAALEVREEPQSRLLETLLDSLRARSLLLILDNCEHLLSGCVTLAEALLGGCPRLQLLATSRQALGVAGERPWRVPSLSLPEGSEADWATEKGAQSILLSSEAAQLFVERARSARPDFRLTPENLVSVARLCSLLDGIPLALELAAAWVRVLPVEQALSRLRERLDLLHERSPGRIERHQTLRATLDWSYGLLEATEKVVLRRLSIFVGGWGLAAAEAVCGWADAGPDEVLMGLAGLVDKSLVVYAEAKGEGRYRLLETTRQYVREKLEQSGEARAIGARHRDHFLALAEEIRPKLSGSEQAHWFGVLEEEHANLRQALMFCLEETEGGEPGLRLGVVLQQFWGTRGYISEGRQYSTALLSHPETQALTRWRADALNGAGNLAYMSSDYAAARAVHEESLTIRRQLGDQRGSAASLTNLGNVAYLQGDYAVARTLYEESLTLNRELGDRQRIANSLTNLGNVAYVQGDYGAARALYEESLVSQRDQGDRFAVANSLHNLGLIAKEQGDYAPAYSLFEESLTIQQELGYRQGIALSLHNLGVMAKEQGDCTAAHPLLAEGLAIFRELGYKQGIIFSLEAFASLADNEDRAEQAACVWGAAEALRAAIRSLLTVSEREKHERAVAAMRQSLGEAAFAAARAKGAGMTLEQAVACALEKQ